MYYLEETHILIFLLQVFILLLFARGLGELFRKLDQPALIGELLAGVLLGPTIFGRFFPGLFGIVFPPDVIQRNMLETIAWLGVLFMLLQTGFEIDFSVAWRHRGKALTIAFAGIIIPLIISFVPSYFLPDKYLMQPDRRILFALFLATVMTISAMPVAARILHDLNLLKTEMGFLIISALAVNDIIGWVIFSIVIGSFMKSTVNLPSIFTILIVSVGFAFFALTLGKKVSTMCLDKLKKFKMGEPATSLTFAVLMGLLFGSITQKIGIHALFGFFIAGIVIGEAKNMSEETRQIISQMVYSIFVPIFFANIGIKMDFIANFNLFLILFVLIIGAAGRYIGAMIGVSLSEIPFLNRNLISLAHVPGGMMEIVIGLVALNSGLISEELFEAIVFSGVFSTIIIAPVMKNIMARRRIIRLTKYISSDSVLNDLKAANREEAIKELCATVSGRLPGSLRNKCIAAAAISRENDFGTALGEGIAVPHIHLAGLRHPILMVGCSRNGIDWNAPDGQLVKYIFFVLSPEGAHDIHVQILSTIAKAMMKVQNKLEMDNSKDDSQLYDSLKKIFSTTIQMKT
ncbi:MAG TPA: hypothetical protein DD381_04895 [Lentisphaeria bacterium]|nr:MAG: hypothetical protein A2X47_01805 [Lentisphaerae bacterium GWF2_38_69]HBM15667.1 hypothetical protein [Lentisphaeria bacterium]